MAWWGRSRPASYPRDLSTFLDGGPHGWVEYDGSSGAVGYVQPTATGTNAPTTRTALVSIAAPSDDVQIQGDAKSSGVVLSVACQSVTRTAPALHVDFATRTATTLSDASLAPAARQAVASTLRSGAATLTCLSASTCLDIDGAGRALTSTYPTGGAGDWSAPVTVDYAGIVALDCPTTTLCLALDSGNNPLWSTTSTGGVWTSQEQVAVLPLG